MKIVALFLALALERLATQLFHWRDLRWLDALFDRGLAFSQRWQSVSPYLWLIATLGVAIAPVVLARFALQDALFGLPYLALSVVVLFLCLGPQDIGEEVDRWSRALRDGDYDKEHIYSRALLERGFNDVQSVRAAVPGAVFVQANNRMFAVIFWFIVLGPVGAWLFRVTDLARRRAVFQSQRLAPDTEIAPDCGQRAADVHALLAWVPARLSAVGYKLAGSYDSGTDAWHAPQDQPAPAFRYSNKHLLRRVGFAALNIEQRAKEDDIEWYARAARSAKNLVLRTLVFWLVGVAVLTLVDVAA